MKTHDVIINILQTLDYSLDDSTLDTDLFNADVLGIGNIRRSYILEMMQDEGLIKGVSFAKGGNRRSYLITFMDDMKITLKGIKYLDENTTTAKIVKTGKLLKDTIPMI